MAQRSDARLLQGLTKRGHIDFVHHWQSYPYIELTNRSVHHALGDDCHEPGWEMHVPLPDEDLGFELPFSEFIMTMEHLPGPAPVEWSVAVDVRREWQELLLTMFQCCR